MENYANAGGIMFAIYGQTENPITYSDDANDSCSDNICAPSYSDMAAADAVMVYSGRTLISSASTMSGANLSAGISQHISSGGIARGTIISGGRQYISSGGVASSTTISSGGYQYVYAGGVARSATVNSGGVQYVFAGGVVNDMAISGGRVYVSSGGTINSTTVYSGGYAHILSGGVIQDVKIVSGGNVYLTEGATVSNTVVANESSYITVWGSAYGTIVSSGARATIGSDAAAYDTTISSGGRVIVYYGAKEIRNTMIKAGGSMQLGYCCGEGMVAYDTTVSSGGLMSVIKCSAVDTIIQNGGIVNFSISAVASNTTVSSGGSAYFYTGITVKNATISSGGLVTWGSAGYSGKITLGATVSTTRVLDMSAAELIFAVDQRTTGDTYIVNNINNFAAATYTVTVKANQTTGSYKLAANAANFNESVTICISGGDCFGLLTVGKSVNYGNYSYSLVNSSGILSLNIGNGSGGGGTSSSTSNAVKLYSGGVLTSFGAAMTGAAVNSGMSQHVSLGGIASGTIVNSGGVQVMSSGGIAVSATINSGGSMIVSSGQALLSGTTVLGGTVNMIGGIDAQNNQVVFALNQRTAANTYIISNIALISNAVYSITVNSSQASGTYSLAAGASEFSKSITVQNTSGTNYGTLAVGGSMTYNNVSYALSVNSSGVLQLAVAGGGGTSSSTSNTVKLYSAGILVSSGATMTGTAVNSGMSQHVSLGGIASLTTVNSGGRQYVSSGGTAVSATVNSGGSMIIASGQAFLSGTTVLGGAMTMIGGIDAQNSQVVFALNQRTAANTYIISNIALVSNAAYSVTVNSNQASGTYKLAAGASGFNKSIMVKNTSGTNYGTLAVGGSITYNNVSYTLSVNSSGVLQLSVAWGAPSSTSNAVKLYSGATLISSGATMSDTIVSSGMSQHVSSGGVVSNTTVLSGGVAYFASEAIVKDAIISSGGLVTWGSADYSGKITLGATVSASTVLDMSGAEIIFAVDQRTTDDTYIVNDINNFSAAIYTITVKADQAVGSYKLAANAADFNEPITICISQGDCFDLLLVGKSVNYGSYTYLLTNSSGILSLDIAVNNNSGDTATSTVRSDLMANGYSQIVAWDAEKGKVGYMATDGVVEPVWNGIWEWSGDEASMWKVVGVGRFSEGIDHDGVLLYNGYGNTFAAWTNLNDGSYGYVSLCHVDGNFKTLALADFDNNGLDDVIIYDENGSFGIVADAATYHDVWHVDSAAANTQQIIGAGYFGNADGKSDILVKNTANGAYYLWHNQDPTFETWNWKQTEIGTLDSDWEVAAIGDFQGDGIDDIIMWQKSTGNMYAWEDGKASTQRWVGQLDASQWEVAAVGDYNGDGKEDLLLRELNSGWGGIGYWAGANASNWTDLNARIETDMESKFAIVA